MYTYKLKEKNGSKVKGKEIGKDGGKHGYTNNYRRKDTNFQKGRG